MIKDLFKTKDMLISFEVFPPKKDEEFENAFALMETMAKLGPDYIGVTYGAGGSKSKKTIEIASYIQNQLNVNAIAHMTCVGARKEDIASVADALKAKGIHSVLALRGDRPSYMTDEQFEHRDFRYASELTAYLKETTDFEIAGGCYPEKHFEALSPEIDLENLKKKCDAGADFLISQLFFDNDLFLRFREKARAAGIQIPIAAGIMPITSNKQLGSTVTLSGSSVPKKLSDLIAKYGDVASDMRKAGTEYAIEQILALKKEGIEDVHIYSMNRPKTTAEIMDAIR